MYNDGHSSGATPPSTDALQPVGCAEDTDTRAEAKLAGYASQHFIYFPTHHLFQHI